jgi:hypothetical protein
MKTQLAYLNMHIPYIYLLEDTHETWVIFEKQIGLQVRCCILAGRKHHLRSKQQITLVSTVRCYF